MCGRCENVTCTCIKGIDIPSTLTRIHGIMKELRSKGLVPPTEVREIAGLKEGYRAKVIMKELPAEVTSERTGICRLHLENSGQLSWHANAHRKQPKIVLCVSLDGVLLQRIHLRHDVHPAQRTHFTFEFSAPHGTGPTEFSLFLAESSHRDKYKFVLPIVEQEIVITNSA